MMSWMTDTLPSDANLWAFRVSPMLEFTTGRRSYSNDTEFARFILSNESVAFLNERNVTHILVDSSLFDSLEVLKSMANNTRVRIDSFRYYGRGTSDGSLYAIFVTGDGKVAYVQVDPLSGNPVEGNVRVVTRDGNMRLIPIKNFLALGDGRLIYPQDNYKVNLFKLFFEEVDGLKPVYTSSGGNTKIYEVAR
jgi:hypothetical protein